ncbi:MULTISPECIES: hypothetical protein [unclassified Mesorhizobium]|uniref:hypothetical protein n=1 Tax=unclassified Mesorhizobium TaxID=325217 RepID=UPI001126FF26|nr:MULTISPECIES: hypothetical protein [unclassified Mesorhizobium]MBZ9984103.1 hypothetical protein [Mesorhizobium sp. BR-1-1-8]TPL59073.1 hypothetical protein FJ949_27985 [Mesorhizobium sp. B2-4-1]
MSPVGIVPAAAEQEVATLLSINNLTGSPFLVPYEDHGYGAQQCHISAKHHAIVHGGKRVHGWAIWRFDDPSSQSIVVAEHHSVWEDLHGNLIDVTTPRYGAVAVLFVRDDNATIHQKGPDYMMRTDLTSWHEVPRMLAGNPTQNEFYPLNPTTRPDVVSYAASLNFNLARIVTEPNIG